MTKRVTSIVTVAALALAGSQSTEAFAPTTSFVPISTGTVSKAPVTFSVRLAEQATDAESAEVTPLTPDTPEEDDTLAMVEKFGRGSAKVSLSFCRHFNPLQLGLTCHFCLSFLVRVGQAWIS